MANKKNEFYWNNYIAAADVACRAAGYLLECMKKFDIEKIGTMLTAMHEFEHEGDSLRHEMTEALAKSFVTPIEREDMQELCQRLDNVIDSIEEVLQAIYFNCIGKISAEAVATSPSSVALPAPSSRSSVSARRVWTISLPAPNSISTLSKA